MLNFKPVFFFTLVFNFHQVALCHSVVFLCFFFFFFALFTQESFLISPCYSLELCIQMGISFLFFFAFYLSFWASLGGSAGKESTCNVGKLGLITGFRRSPGDNSFPFQYSDLENCMDCSVGSQRVRHD